MKSVVLNRQCFSQFFSDQFVFFPCFPPVFPTFRSFATPWAPHPSERSWRRPRPPRSPRTAAASGPPPAEPPGEVGEVRLVFGKFMVFTNNKTTPVKQPFVKFTTHNLAFTVNLRNSPGKSRQIGWCWLVFSAFTLEFLGCGSINFAYGKLRNISTTEWLTYIKPEKAENTCSWLKEDQQANWTCWNWTTKFEKWTVESWEKMNHWLQSIKIWIDRMMS